MFSSRISVDSTAAVFLYMSLNTKAGLPMTRPVRFLITKSRNAHPTYCGYSGSFWSKSEGKNALLGAEPSKEEMVDGV